MCECGVGDKAVPGKNTLKSPRSFNKDRPSIGAIIGKQTLSDT